MASSSRCIALANSDTGLRAITFHKNQYGPASATCFVHPFARQAANQAIHGKPVLRCNQSFRSPCLAPLPAALVAEEIDACFIVRDAERHALAYGYFEAEPEGL